MPLPYKHGGCIIKNYCIQKSFPGVSVPSWQAIYNLNNGFEETESVADLLQKGL